MTFKELTLAAAPYRLAVVLDGSLPRNLRLALRYFFLVISFSSFAASFVDFGGSLHNSLPDGLFFLFLSLFGIMFLLEAFYNSSKFSFVDSEARIDFSVAAIILKTDDIDITAGFLNSPEAGYFLKRLGISKEEKELFLNAEREKLLAPSFEVGGIENQYVDLALYAKALYTSDKSFYSFISARAVSREDFTGAAEWITSDMDKKISKERWWSKDHLESIPSIGTSLSYGESPELSKYALPVLNATSLNEIDIEGGYREREVVQLENALIKGNEANAILVDNDQTVAEDIVKRLSKKIKLGLSPGVLEHKIVLKLDWNTLMADKKSKPELEDEYIEMLYESASAGNVILYIPNLPSFMAEARKIGVNLSSLMEEYLVSPKIHIIGHSTKTDFYYFIEMNAGLGRVFERVIPDDMGVKSSMPAILEKAKQIEFNYGGRLFFTYPALAEIAELADRYISYGEMPTKALDLMVEFAPWAAQEGLDIIFKNDVDVFVSSKTGHALGEISQAESLKLIKLEELMHQRIVGQNEAVSAVSESLRRSRTGVGNAKRPIASFLFLGPSGVGKTETAKALAESFFGNEEKMTRFDMSEYNGADAAPRLIGSFSEARIGNLSSKLRDNPYGVVLLDEFEKAAPDVLNLFLRILDEGKFTDAFGGEVSVRNSIIIATSNAGSEMIWNIVRSGGNLENKKDSIIDYLVDKHIFKPELLNRFDAVVIFKPLLDTELRSIAEKMLHKFIERLRQEKQIELKPSSELLDYLVLHGSDKEFGARAINRIMQEKIEDAIAKKIIAKTARAGSVVEIGVKDIL